MIVYYKDGLIFKEFESVNLIANYFKADHKIITKYINSKNLYKSNYYLSYKK
jgi:hypothetical protein